MLKRRTVPILIAPIFLLGFQPVAQEALFKIPSEDPGDGRTGTFGAAVAAAGDIRGTGKPGIIVGDPEFDSGGAQGRVQVFAGSSNALWTRFGHQVQPENRARFGASVAGGADLNGDLVPDVVVGAPDSLLIGEVGYEEYVSVLSGVDGQELTTIFAADVGATTIGGGPVLFGSAVAFVGDVDKDGTVDFAVGAPLESSIDANTQRRYRGVIRVFSGVPGQPTLLVTRRSEAAGFGHSVSGIGDVDSDGRPDLLVGAPASGRAFILRTVENEEVLAANDYLVLPGLVQAQRVAPAYAAAVGDFDSDSILDVGVQSGPTSAQVRSGATGKLLRSFPLPSTLAGDLVVGSAGDFDDDGTQDLALGQPLTTNRGRSSFVPNPNDRHVPQCDGGLYVLSGKSGELRAFLPGAFDTQGWSVASLIGEDGRSDIATGAPYLFAGDVFENGNSSFGGGGVLVFTHKTTELNYLTIFGEVRNAGFGRDVAGGRDLDGDQKNDLVVASPQDPTRGPNAGRVQVFKGQTGKKLKDFLGETSGDYFGFSIAIIDDVENDGISNDTDNIDELVIGAPGMNANGRNDSGRVYVYSCGTGALLYTVDGGLAGDTFGASVARAGDCNGDGYDDFIVGAPRCLQIAPVQACESMNGYARVCSGRDGSLIRTLTEPTAVDFGRYVDGGGRLDDDDEVPDVVVASTREQFFDDQNQLHIGAVYAYSGSTGQTIHIWRGEDDYGRIRSSGGEQFGVNVTIVGDVDGLGREDVALAVHDREFSGFSRVDIFGGHVVFSGEDGGAFDVVPNHDLFIGTYPYNSFAGPGYALAGIGDASGDGLSDFVASDPATNSNGFRVRGGRIAGWPGGGGNIQGFTDDDYYGYSVARGGDLDDDGIEDMIVGIPADPDNQENFQVGWNRVMIVRGVAAPGPAPVGWGKNGGIGGRSAGGGAGLPKQPTSEAGKR